MKMGRKRTFIWATVIGFIGVVITMFESLSAIIIGRVIYGFGCGILSIVGPRFIEETVPDNLLSLYSPMFMTASAVGAMISLLLGVGLPDDTDKKALSESDYWRVVMGAPLIL